MAPTVVVTVATGQRVHLSSHKVMGSTGSPSWLETGVCYQSTGGGALTVVGERMIGLTANWNSIPWGATAVFSPSAGSYNAGLCALTGGPASWNLNDWGYTSALVFQP